MSNIWEALRINFMFGVVDESPRIQCVNCDDDAQATNPDQVTKWAKHHLNVCSGLIPESDLAELGFNNPDVAWYEGKEILDDDE